MILFESKSMRISAAEAAKLMAVCGGANAEEAVLNLITLAGLGRVLVLPTKAQQAKADKQRAEARARIEQKVMHWKPSREEESELARISAQMDKETRNERTAKKAASPRTAAKSVAQKARGEGAKKRPRTVAAKPTARGAGRAGVSASY